MGCRVGINSSRVGGGGCGVGGRFGGDSSTKLFLQSIYLDSGRPLQLLQLILGRAVDKAADAFLLPLDRTGMSSMAWVALPISLDSDISLSDVTVPRELVCGRTGRASR